MSFIQIDGLGVADFIFLVDSSGYDGGDNSYTTITMTNIPDGFTFHFSSLETPVNPIPKDIGVSIEIKGDIELDAFRRGLKILSKELDQYFGNEIEEIPGDKPQPSELDQKVQRLQRFAVQKALHLGKYTGIKEIGKAILDGSLQEHDLFTLDSQESEQFSNGSPLPPAPFDGPHPF